MGLFAVLVSSPQPSALEKDLTQSGAEIVQLSERPAIINLGYTVTAHDIKTNNTGRLAAKFLRSFFPD
jgi:hypothetical protein